MKQLLLLLFAYFMGSIPTGVWIGKQFYHKDIRQYGSGNSGSTNTFRVLGKQAGIIVLTIDILKGTIPVVVAIALGTTWHPLIIGLFAILGHTYPIFAHFKGGKAVATFAGIMLGYLPLLFIEVIIVFAIILYFTRMVSLTSMVTIFLGWLWVLYYYNDPVLHWIVFGVFIFIVYRHRSNVKRLLDGTESKVPFGFRSKQK
ncbi:glycerol-3-phosphate 1-O-acyltransferase PlsY [Atopobacter phocae]|uniref:glycerol-3-phosphate 1-O-acyltransferase PlsY n=1 Tax=Atopobacter phocae TaxID=136492 RepID=UPI00046F5B6F|nr:glycerol-3-phosphate 1-O-acyltransferase PlsY [Atopobacter phocae]